jgi:hypothetical protein
VNTNQEVNVTTTTVTQATQAMEARVLGILRDGRVWGGEELAERLADEVGREATALVPKAVERLVEAGLAHRVSEDLVAASWRGMRGAAAGNPDGTLQVSEGTSGVGFVEPVNDREAPDRLRGGAEDLPGRLVSAGD